MTGEGEQAGKYHEDPTGRFAEGLPRSGKDSLVIVEERSRNLELRAAMRKTNWSRDPENKGKGHKRR